MKYLWLVLLLFLSTVYSASTTDPPKKDGNATIKPWYETQDYSYSVTVDMRKNGTSIKYCGGAQVGREWVLTAAECLHDTGGDAIVMTYSSAKIKYKLKFFLMQRAIFVIYPEYDPKTKANNIALIQCKYCGIQRENVIPTVPLRSLRKYSTREPAVVTAVLSITHDKAIYGYYVNSVKTHVVSQFWCKVAHFFSVGKDHICGSRLAGRLPKANEIGAPLVVEGDLQGMVHLVGVGTSVFHWPEWIPFPMVFTRVDPYSDWIRNVTGIK